MDLKDIRETALKTLAALGRLPAAPYYEHRGAGYVRAFCEDAGLEVHADRWGNVLASRPGSSPDAPGLAFVAHLDHPGFEAVEERDGDLVCDALGGIPPGALERGVKVLVLSPKEPPGDSIDPASLHNRTTAPDYERIPGEIVRAVPVSEDAHDTPPRDRSVIVRPVRPVAHLPCSVVFDLPDFDLDADTIRMRALDDLAGCAASLAALKAVAAGPTPGAVYGLFTRAEETGLIGARLAAADGLLPRNTVVVSVESSRAIPGAQIGRGPVIRTGDVRTTFDSRAEAYLTVARERLSARVGTFPWQRQLMSGGTCEASAFSAFGYSVTGLAFPLGNYHNAGPDNSVAAEYISLADFAGGAALLAEAASLAGTSPVSASGERMRSRPEEEARRLSAGQAAPGGKTAGFSP
jgi:endoglucanase